MCGIAGFIDREGDPEVLSRMLEALRSRGPDGSGTVAVRHGDFHVMFGHRRLSIIDLEGGKQPMSTADGRGSLITYNGETYNFESIREKWAARGERFATRSDTEAVLVQLARLGAEGLRELDGMFALGLWAGDRLLLARDRYGVKPLYYAPLPGGGIAFASELGALFAHPGIERRIDAEGLLSYLASDYAHAPLTLAKNVRKLEPGASLEWKDGSIAAPRRYWSVPVVGAGRGRPRAQELWERLDAAVERQMIADVPVGVLLSGGLDSSCVGVLAARHAKGRLSTFSVGFEDASFDESEYARLMASRLGSRHHERFLTSSNVLGVIDEALDRLDEPLGDHAYLPNYLLCQMVSEHVKVALGGDACDELWGGYPTYRAHRLASVYRLAPGLLHRVLRDRVVPHLPVSDAYQAWDWKVRKFTGGYHADLSQRHFEWMLSVSLPELSQAMPGQSPALPAVFRTPSPSAADPISGALALDLVTYLPGSILTKVDRSSMAHGLEVRPPFLDNAFVEWSLAQPSRSKVSFRGGKLLVKEAARPHVPAAIVDRKKRGFGMPVVAWMRGVLQPRVAEAFSNDRLFEPGLLDRDTFLRWNDAHRAGRADYGKVLWALVVLDHWVRRYDVAA